MTSLTCTSAVGTFLPCLLIFQGELPEFTAGHQLPAKWLYSTVTGKNCAVYVVTILSFLFTE